MWGVRRIKVILEDDATGEELVIERGPDGKTGAPGKPRPAKPSNAKADKPPASAKADKPPASAKTDKPPVSAKADKPPPSPAASTKTAKTGSGRKAASRQAGKSLVWSPVKDNGYQGFTARSGGGKFKLLKAQNTQWALFFELRGTDARKVGCFVSETKAKVRAQELHDEGWPGDQTSGEVTEADLAQACPMPDDDKKKEPRVKKPETKTEKEPPTPAPMPATEAEQDKELLGSFTKELDAVLDEDDD